jgi:deazaflavin-dependent oxidoreductase (nitroreductase family)
VEDLERLRLVDPQRASDPLGGFPDGDDTWLVVASKSGSPSHPAWFINLAKHPDQVWLEVGNRKLRVAVESLTGAERERALARVAAVAPRYGQYQQKTDREIPVLRLTPADKFARVPI